VSKKEIKQIHELIKHIKINNYKKLPKKQYWGNQSIKHNWQKALGYNREIEQNERTQTVIIPTHENNNTITTQYINKTQKRHHMQNHEERKQTKQESPETNTNTQTHETAKRKLNLREQKDEGQTNVPTERNKLQLN